MANQELTDNLIKVTKQDLPTIDIRGKSYVQVKDRVAYFVETFPEDGSITTELLSKPEDKLVVMKATVTIGERVFTGHSQAMTGDKGVNLTAAMENAETSAVGRALGFAGIGIIESVASADEVDKSIKSGNSFEI